MVRFPKCASITPPAIRRTERPLASTSSADNRICGRNNGSGGGGGGINVVINITTINLQSMGALLR